MNTFPGAPVDTLWINANVATMTGVDVPHGLMENAAIAIHNGRIQWLGKFRCAR